MEYRNTIPEGVIHLLSKKNKLTELVYDKKMIDFVLENGKIISEDIYEEFDREFGNAQNYWVEYIAPEENIIFKKIMEKVAEIDQDDLVLFRVVDFYFIVDRGNYMRVTKSSMKGISNDLKGFLKNNLSISQLIIRDFEILNYKKNIETVYKMYWYPKDKISGTNSGAGETSAWVSSDEFRLKNISSDQYKIIELQQSCRLKKVV